MMKHLLSVAGKPYQALLRRAFGHRSKLKSTLDGFVKVQLLLCVFSPEFAGLFLVVVHPWKNPKILHEVTQ